jgi:hypothetical protein
MNAGREGTGRGSPALWLTLAAIVLVAGPSASSVAQVSKAPVPSSPFLGVAYRYADAMLEKGRDTHGPQKSGLFLSALDRKSLAPLSERPPAPAGVGESQRAGSSPGALTGANLQHDQNLLRLLYTLSELSGKATYRESADAALRWFLEHTPSPNTGLLPWGEHLAWDVVKDEPVASDGAEDGTHSFRRPWLLWDRSFDLAPEASARFALGLWEHHVADHQSGAFDRRAGFRRNAAHDGLDSARDAGFYIRTWAVAYARTKEERFTMAIEALLGRFEKRRHAKTGLIAAHSGAAEASVSSTLSLAVDCDGAAHRVPEPLASRLRAFAAREDEVFCSLPHDLKRSGGFVSHVIAASGEPSGLMTPLWDPGASAPTTAQVALMCVARYEATAKVAYREIIHAAADAYLDSKPPEDLEVWPATFGHAISLELAAWRSAARQVYLDRARELADHAVAAFFVASPLPRASTRAEHYESITGAGTLALALVELHLHILYITAVKWAPNSADR